MSFGAEPNPRRRIAVLLYGSRGDIQPGLCLALELQRRGHRVNVLAPPNLVDLAVAVGIEEVFPVGLDTHTAWSSEEATTAQKRRNPVTRARFALRTVRAGFAAFDASLMRLFIDDNAPLGGVDALVAAPLCQDRGLAIAERLGIPMTVLRYGPMSVNGVIGPVPAAAENWSPAARRRAWRAADWVTWFATGANEASFRRRLGLRRPRSPLPNRLSALGITQIQAYDPVLLPGIADEWGSEKPVVGFFDLPTISRAGLDEIRENNAELAQWLDAGSPPLFITFGSMPIPDPQAVVDILCASASGVGLRALVSVGDRSGPSEEDPEVFYVSSVDHASILPRCAAAAHHGGAGTTAAGLRAGLPTLVCAFTADQPTWAHRVSTLGIGYGMRLRDLNQDTGRRALETLVAPSTVANARDLAARMVPPEVAVATAASIVESRTSTT